MANIADSCVSEKKIRFHRNPLKFYDHIKSLFENKSACKNH